MAIVHPTAENFDALIRDNKLVLVDFFATWCGPCKMIAPFIEEVAEEYEGKAVVANRRRIRHLQHPDRHPL